MNLLKDISTLLKVQEKEGELLSLEERKKQLPVLLDEGKDRLRNVEERLAEAKDGMRELQLKKKELELESESELAKIAKYEQQLYAIKSNTEYQALQKEITDIQIDNSRIEDKILEVMEEVEEKSLGVKHCEGEIEKEKARLAVDEERIAEEAVKLDERMAELRTERDRLLPGIDEFLLGKYRRIFKKRRDSAIVPLLDYKCGGCHMRLPPNVAVNVRKGDELVVCENCSRILYWVEGVAKSAAPQNEAPSVVAE